MKTCVLFAASIFDVSRLDVLHDFFSTFKTHFSDADFYVGINYGSILNLENEIKKYELNCDICRLEDERLYTKTDASAYQLAVQTLKTSNKKYDIYWFAHTKGGVNSRNDIRQMYIDDMFTQRQSIEQMFQEYPQLGSWGIRGNSISGAGVQWKNYNVDCGVPICSNVKFSPFDYTHVNWSYIETLYVLKKEAFEAYLDLQSHEFFSTRLDPWYFETVPGWIPSRCGYFPYVKIKRDFFDKCELTHITNEWINENNLDLYPYLNL